MQYFNCKITRDDKKVYYRHLEKLNVDYLFFYLAPEHAEAEFPVVIVLLLPALYPFFYRGNNVKVYLNTIFSVYILYHFL